MILTENPKQLVIVNNEKIFNDKGEFYCDNLDIKSIPEGLKKDFDVLLISRKSKTKKSHNIILKNVVASSNIFFLRNAGWQLAFLLPASSECRYIAKTTK